MVDSMVTESVGHGVKFLLRYNLDCSHGCVVLEGNEFQEELALCIGLQACNSAYERTALAGLIENVDLTQDEPAVAEHIEETGSRRGLEIAGKLTLIARVEVAFNEMQCGHVLAGRHRNRV